jgi:hypothetical protein
LQLHIALNQDGAVGADGQRGTQGFLAGGNAAGDGDDFSREAGFLEAHGFFDGDFVEGVHAHLDVGQVDARAVRFDADFDVVVDDPFDGYE